MARILVQRGSSSNASHRSTPSSSASATEPPPVTVYEETTDEVNVVEEEEEEAECSDAKDVSSLPSDEPLDREDDDEGLVVSENAALVVVEGEGVDCDSLVSGGDVPDSPPLPVPPPPKPSSNRRSILGSFGDLQIGATRRGAGPRSLVSTRGSPTGSHPSSPRSQSENEGYNSSDEHTPSFTPSHAGSGSVKCFFFFQKNISLKPLALFSINIYIYIHIYIYIFPALIGTRTSV